MLTQCPFCHQQVPTEAYPEHERTHTRRQPDGQMEEHITLPPEQRLAGELSGVPRVYLHWNCGAKTRMPEEIIRSYLRDPLLYSGMTFCAGCHDYVPDRELTWTETGESLAIYMQRLKDGFLAERVGRTPPPAPNRRDFSPWRVLVLLLILVIVVPALVIDTLMALHAGARSASTLRPAPVAISPTVPLPRPAVLPPPVILGSPSPPPVALSPAVPNESFRPRLPNPMTSTDQSTLIRQAALAAIPAFIRQFRPVQTATGSLSVKTLDVLQSSSSEAVVTVHYEVKETPEADSGQPGAAQVIVIRRGMAWVAVSATPVGTR